MIFGILDERISHLSKARGIDIWRWVWTVSVDQGQSSKRLMTLLTKTVNLIELEARISASPELLVTVRQHYPSLRSLKVLVNTDSHEAMAQVGLFEHVKHLDIRTRRSNPSRKQPTDPLDPFTDAQSWNMPTVTHFRWQDLFSSHFPHDAIFVSRCRFPHLQHLDLEIEHPHADLDGMPHICRLLDAHRNITSLRLLLKEEGHLNIIPFVRARNLWVTFRSNFRCTPRAVVPLLRPEVKNLEFEFKKYMWESSEQALTIMLLELLAQFAAEHSALSTLEKIRLRSSAGPTGSYDLAPTTKEGFLRTLGSHILPLKAHGIRVFVEDCEIGM
jgi:hypothetical protein